MEKTIVLPIGNNNVPPPVTTPPITNSLTEIVIGVDKYNINTDGNAIDKDGKVLKTKDELEQLKAAIPIVPADDKNTPDADKIKSIESQLIEGAEIELDNIKYVLNKDGNAVDSTGKVIKTKDELKSLLLVNDTTDEVDYITEIQKATNLILTNENNQPVTYENTVPGITKYVQDVYTEGRKLGRTEYEQEILSKYPVVSDIIEHLTIHGSLDNFVENVDYSKVSITDDETQQIDIYTKAKLQQGLSKEEISDLIGYLKSDKKLKTAAETSLAYLTKLQVTNATDRANKVAEIKAKEDADRLEYWNSVNSILNSKQLVVDDKKFTIPEVIKVKETDGKVVTKTIKDFVDYIEKPLTFNVNGTIYTMTQLEYDEAIEDTKRTPHHDLFDAYRKFTKYDDSQLIAANISDNVVKKIIKLTTKATGGGSGTATKGGKLVLPIK